MIFITTGTRLSGESKLLTRVLDPNATTIDFLNCKLLLKF